MFLEFWLSAERGSFGFTSIIDYFDAVVNEKIGKRAKLRKLDFLRNHGVAPVEYEDETVECDGAVTLHRLFGGLTV